jgi:hypothetical protein
MERENSLKHCNICMLAHGEMYDDTRETNDPDGYAHKIHNHFLPHPFHSTIRRCITHALEVASLNKPI